MRKTILWGALSLPLLCGCDDLGEVIADSVRTDVTIHVMQIDVATGELTPRSAPPGEPLIVTPPVVTPGGEMAFIGVTDGTDVTVDNMVWLYDPTTDTWRESAPWENLRSHTEWVTFDGRVCAGSGFVPGNQILQILECFDADEDRWSTLEPPPIWATEIVAVDDAIYAFDGDRSPIGTDATTRAAVFADGSWRDIADKPVCAATEAAEHEGRIFVFGCPPESRGVATYDIATDTWMEPVDLDETVSGDSVQRETVTIGSKLYLANGPLLEIDTDSMSPRRLTPPGPGSILKTVAALGDALITSRETSTSASVLIYDTATEVWIESEPLSLSTLFSEGRVVVVGDDVFWVVVELESVGVTTP